MGSINNLIIGLIKAAPISLTWINVKSITDIHRSLSWLSSSHYCCHRCYFDRTSAITPIFIVPANTASPSPDSDWVHLEDNAARKNTSITTNKAGGGGLPSPSAPGLHWLWARPQPSGLLQGCQSPQSRSLSTQTTQERRENRGEKKSIG